MHKNKNFAIHLLKFLAQAFSERMYFSSSRVDFLANIVFFNSFRILQLFENSIARQLNFDNENLK